MPLSTLSFGKIY